MFEQMVLRRGAPLRGKAQARGLSASEGVEAPRLQVFCLERLHLPEGTDSRQGKTDEELPVAGPVTVGKDGAPALAFVFEGIVRLEKCTAVDGVAASVMENERF